jgi:SOS-response transcriptional repressor LexA
VARKKTPKVRLSIKTALSRRLREIRQELFGDHGGPELARRLNLPARTWYNYETGVTVPAEVLLAFIELTGASPAFLTSGEGPRYAGRADELRPAELSPIELIRRGLEKLERERSASEADDLVPTCRDSAEFQSVPVFPIDELLKPRLDQSAAVGRVLAYRQWLPNPAATVAARVQGDAMSPILPAGSVAAIDRTDVAPADLQGKIVAARKDGELLIRWLDLSGRHAILRPNNSGPFHPLVSVVLDEAPDDFLVGRVVWSWSRFTED